MVLLHGVQQPLDLCSDDIILFKVGSILCHLLSPLIFVNHSIVFHPGAGPSASSNCVFLSALTKDCQLDRLG